MPRAVIIHTCIHCSRSFKRAEHLTRHLRTHTREKPYVCRCGEAFTRRDLLTRHWRLTQHVGDANIEPPSLSARAPELDGDTRQCDPLDTRRVPSVGMTSSGPLDLHVDSTHQDPPVYSTPAAALQDIQAPSFVANDPNQCEEGFEDFRDFVNFIDGVGLSALWTPEYDLDWPSIGDYNLDSQRHSPDPDSTRSPGAEDIGTPFSTWLPSAPADDQVHLRSQSSDGSRERHTKIGTYLVTEEHRNHLLAHLSTLPTNISRFNVPSRHAMSRYLTAFFGGFHSHFPFIHIPTFKPSTSPLELTLAMAAAGAQYCFERKIAERLFRVAKAIVLERLRQDSEWVRNKASFFSAQTLAMISSNIRHSLMPKPESRPTEPWSPLDLAKTLLILVGFATWERTHLLQDAFSLRNLLVQILRDVGLREEIKPNEPSSPSLRWDQWIQRESARRTKLVAFCYVNVHSIAYNSHPLLWSSEMHLKLPCGTPVWQATSAAQWAAQREGKEDQMLFQDALAKLLQQTTTNGLVRPIPSPIGNYVLLHALLQRIHVVRELSVPTISPTPISASDLQIMAGALRSWTSLWQQTPESTLDPNNEGGPIPFTSSALLVVAYVRLSLNIGPHRHLESREPSVIATGLSQIPKIERNDNMLSALLYSTHALSIPVRLGIDRIARSQAFFWSVQHAISSFDSAIFLAKWLCSLPDASQDESMSRSEQRILHWVRCIIKEAYAVIDFGDWCCENCDDFGEEPVDPTPPNEPHSLGLAVLSIWSRFFRGNTQWQFVVDLGVSLEEYRKGMDRCQLEISLESTQQDLQA